MAIDSRPSAPELLTASPTSIRADERWWSRFIPWTLAGRLAVTFALVTAVVTIALGVFLDVAIRSLYLDRLESQLASQANVVGRSLSGQLATDPSIATIDPLVKAYSEDINARITIIAPDGTVLGDSSADPAQMNNHLDRPEIAEAVRDGSGSIQRKSGTVNAKYLYVAVQIPGASTYIAETALPVSQVDDAMADVRRRIAAGTLIAVAISVAAGLLVSRKITASLNDVRDSAVRVAAGDLTSTVEPPSTREMADLANAFNAMTSQIDTLVEESRRARMRWASAFASLGDGMLLVNNDENVTAINIAAADLLDTDPDWAVNQAFVVVARDHELTALLRDSLQRQEMRRSVIEMSRGNRFIEATARPVAGYKERYTIITLRDVTELRRLESVRREFVANVSHELRTPLASIRAVVETLEGGAIDDPEVADDFLHRIVGEVDRLAALVDDLLDLARLETGRVHLSLDVLDPLDLLSRAAERLRPQIERARLTLLIDVPPDLPPVLADRARIEQVLLNLVHNAIKFTPAGGSITVRARVVGDELVTEVIDTGAGIPESDLPRLFERFYKADKARRSEGTGLGLAITKHIVQIHNGAIAVSSTLKQGSTFTFTLPLASSSNATQPNALHTA